MNTTTTVIRITADDLSKFVVSLACLLWFFFLLIRGVVRETYDVVLLSALCLTYILVGYAGMVVDLKRQINGTTGEESEEEQQ